jgi:hypothetical protein
MCCCGLQWPVVQLEGSIKSAQTLFARYDMDLDLRLRQQDYYDLMLELNLALPYQDYQRFIDGTFTYAGMYAWPANGVPSSTQPRVVEQVLSCACHHDGGVFLGHSDDLPSYCPGTCRCRPRRLFDNRRFHSIVQVYSCCAARLQKAGSSQQWPD